MRLFFAIDVPLEIKNFFGEINQELKNVSGIRSVSKDSIHLTLLFLGDKDPEEVVRKVKDLNFKPFVLKASRFGFFPNKKR